MPLVSQSRRSVIGIAFASNQINATIFRVNAVASAGPFQFATYYNPKGVLIMARRQPGSSSSDKWDQVALPVRGNPKDAHNGSVVGISADGIIHVAYDHHNSPLHYRRTTRPYDIRSFGDQLPMTGQHEGSVTYPQFVSAPDGTLYFFYRDGASGNGSLCINRYEPSQKTWMPIHHPLIDGQGRVNPYWWRPSIGADGTIHLAWCWRDTPDAQSNHDICYMRSSDRGQTWRTAEGKPLRLPVTQATAPVANRIPTGSNLINQCSTAVDAWGHPHIAHYHNDAAGIPQYFHLWHDGKRWVRHAVSHRRTSFRLGGGGTLQIPICRPEIAISQNGTVHLITRDAEVGNGIRLYRSRGRDYSRWSPVEVTPPGEDLGDWEPSYDQTRLRRTGILSLFVLPVQQGDHEKNAQIRPRRAFLLELPLS